MALASALGPSFALSSNISQKGNHLREKKCKKQKTFAKPRGDLTKSKNPVTSECRLGVFTASYVFSSPNLGLVSLKKKIDG